MFLKMQNFPIFIYARAITISKLKLIKSLSYVSTGKNANSPSAHFKNTAISDVLDQALWLLERGGSLNF